jgi:nucleoid-associated protein YgaU
VAGPDAPARVASTDDSAKSIVVVPAIQTKIVSRGDSLWRISEQTYGSGVRYPVIFHANQQQIRNPNLIYPGQIFVLPDQSQAQSETRR